MRLVSLVAAGAFLVATIGTAVADPPVGRFVCTVEQKAGIGGVHLENAPPPSAFVAPHDHYRFAISIERASSRYRVTEAPYAGRDRDPSEWDTPNSVLRAPYDGDGSAFTESEDQGFLTLGSLDPVTGGFWFYLAAYEYPGGEDTNLAVRFGHCVLRRS